MLKSRKIPIPLDDLYDKVNVTSSTTFEALTLIEDESVSGQNVDELGALIFAKVIAGAAKGTVGPFTIGVFGDWGHGKTSVLRQAKSILDADKDPTIRIVTVMFNAWQFEHEEHPIVPLVATIVAAVESKLVEWKTNSARVADASIEALRKIGRALRALAYGFSAKTKVGVPGFAEIEAGFVAREIIDRHEKLVTAGDPLLERTLYYNAFEALDRAAGTAASSEGAPRHKIVVFVDDLDRCLPPQALKLLESIKIALAQRGFIFVLAVDQRIIQGYLTQRYAKEFSVSDYEVGPSYLDKIIQLPLPLPSHRGRFKRYIESLVENRAALSSPSNSDVKSAVLKLVDLLATGSNHNPRSLVRFINTLIIDRAIWQARGGKKVDVDLLGMCAVSRILRQQLGERLYHLLVSSDEICGALASGSIERLRTSRDISRGTDGSPRPKGHRELLSRLEEHTFIINLWKIPFGKKWLTGGRERREVDEFLARRLQPEDSRTGAELIASAIREEFRLPPEKPVSDEHRRALILLDLSRTAIRDSDMPLVGTLPSLKHLYLRNTSIGDSGLQPLARLRELELLSLDGTEISDSGLLHLAGLSTLKKLSVAETLIDGHGLRHLCNLVNLAELSLERTQVNDDAMRYLHELPKLEVIMLDRTSVGDDGAELLGRCKSLHTIWLSNTEVGNSGLRHLAKLVLAKTLSLDGTKVNDAGMKYLAQMVDLQVLSLDRGDISDRGIAFLAPLTKLHTLWLTGTKITDDGLRRLKGMRKMRRLWLKETKVTDAGLRHLSNMLALEELALEATRVTDSGLSFLKRHGQLRRVWVKGIKISDAARKAFERDHPTCILEQ